MPRKKSLHVGTILFFLATRYFSFCKKKNIQENSFFRHEKTGMSQVRKVRKKAVKKIVGQEIQEKSGKRLTKSVKFSIFHKYIKDCSLVAIEMPRR